MPCTQWTLSILATSLNCPELYIKNFSSRGRRWVDLSSGLSRSTGRRSCENSLALERRAGLPGKRKMPISSQAKKTRSVL